MAEDSAPESQEDGGAQPQEGTPQGQEPQQQTQQSGGLASLPQEMQDYIKQLRRENASHRKRSEELSSKVKEFEEAQLSEQERSQKRLSELERENTLLKQQQQGIKVDRYIERAATKMGFVDPEDAVELVPRADIQFDDDGDPKPKTIEAALRDLAARKPHLITTRSGWGNSDGGPRSLSTPKDMNDLIRAARRR